MAWERMTPKRGTRPLVQARVKLSWLKYPGKGPVLAVSIGRGIAQVMGWPAKGRLLVERDMTAGLLRFTLTEEPGGSFSYHTKVGKGTVTFGLTLHEITGPNTRATAVHHTIEGNALIVDLLDWMVPLDVQAERLLIRGMEPRKVAEDLDMDQARVGLMAARLRREGKIPARAA